MLASVFRGGQRESRRPAQECPTHSPARPRPHPCQPYFRIPAYLFGVLAAYFFYQTVSDRPVPNGVNIQSAPRVKPPTLVKQCQSPGCLFVFFFRRRLPVVP